MIGYSDALKVIDVDMISSISGGSVGLDSRGYRISLDFDGVIKI